MLKLKQRQALAGLQNNTTTGMTSTTQVGGKTMLGQ